MVKRKQKPDDINIVDNPISEGLRQIIRGRKTKTKDVEEVFGLKKPRYYSFLKRERGLSQEALDTLAARLGVRIVLGEGQPDPTESCDSKSTPTGMGLSCGFPEILARIESAIDEAFVEFGAPPHEGRPSPGPGGEAAWRRLEVWLRPRPGDVGGSAGVPPGDEARAGWLPADCLIDTSSLRQAGLPMGSRLDALKASILLGIRRSLGVTENESRSPGPVAGGDLQPLAGPGPAAGGPGDSPLEDSGPSHPTLPSVRGGFIDVASNATSNVTGEDYHSTYSSTGDGGEMVGQTPVPARPEPSAPEPTATHARGDDPAGPAAAREDQLAAAAGPGGIDGVRPDKAGEEAETGAPSTTKKTRRTRSKPPEMEFVPKDELGDDDDDEQYPDEDDDEELPNSSIADDEEDDDEEIPHSSIASDKGDDDEGNSLRNQLNAMKNLLGDLPPMPELDDDLPPPKPRPETDNAKKADDDAPKRYVFSSGNTAARTLKALSTGTKAEWSDRIKAVFHDIPDGPAKEFAKRYMQLKGGPSIKERDKFFNFIRQLKAHNPDAQRILMAKDFGDRYKEIAAHIDDPFHMAYIGDDISYGQFFPLSDNPDQVKNQWDRILQARGIRNGVKMGQPRKRSPRESLSPSAAKVTNATQAESIQHLKQEYLRRLQGVDASVLRSKEQLDPSGLTMSEQVQVYLKALKEG